MWAPRCSAFDGAARVSRRIDAMSAAASVALRMRSCDEEAQRLSDGRDGRQFLTKLGGVSSSATAAAVSSGFSGSTSGERSGLGCGSVRLGGSLGTREAAGAAELVGTVTIGYHLGSGGGGSSSSGHSYSYKEGSRGQSDDVVGDGGCGRVWGYRGQRIGEAAHPGPAAATTAAEEVQQLREGLAAIKHQLEIQDRHWYVHQSGCRCKLCVVQLEMQELRRQVRTLTLALAMQKHGNQSVHQQSQQTSMKCRKARKDKDGRWCKLPRPHVTIRMKVAAVLAEKAAEAATSEAVAAEATTAEAEAAAQAADAKAAIAAAEADEVAAVETAEAAAATATEVAAKAAGAAATTAGISAVAAAEEAETSEATVAQSEMQFRPPRPKPSRNQRKQQTQRRRQAKAGRKQREQQGQHERKMQNELRQAEREKQEEERMQHRVKQAVHREQQKAHDKLLTHTVLELKDQVRGTEGWVKERIREKIRKEKGQREERVEDLQEQLDELDSRLMEGLHSLGEQSGKLKQETALNGDQFVFLARRLEELRRDVHNY